ncbi:MAG: metallophosphoesterase [Alphaproteobacteria bacterium]|nr:metallophosphoesterase [Alphaproteobacteria bacterium]MCB9797822.1 metallophosphoesterase [Alphaproteobacteria bacterium]
MTAILPTLLLYLACADPAKGDPSSDTPSSDTPGADSASEGESGADSQPAADDSDGGDDSAEDSAAPQPDPPQVVRFVAMGDGGEGNSDQYTNAAAVASVCAARGCDFVLYLGDNFYDDGVNSADDEQFQSKFELPYADVDLPFMVVLGNHDYGVVPLWGYKAEYQVEYSDTSDKFNLPDRYYSFVQEHVTFIGLDTSDVFLWGGGDQQPWLDEQIANASSDWIIAFGHHPYVSNGQHGNAGEYEGFEWLPIANGAAVKEFMDESLCGRVHFYFSGHDHNRQWLEPTCGTEFIVTGAAAKTTDLQDRGNPVFFEDDSSEGFFWIEISDDTLTGVVYDLNGQEQFSRTTTRGW